MVGSIKNVAEEGGGYRDHLIWRRTHDSMYISIVIDMLLIENWIL